MSGEGICFVLGVAAAGIVTMFSYKSSIYPYDIEKAAEICQTNQGASYITQDFGGTNLEIVCKNGARFYWREVVKETEHDDSNQSS